MLCINGVVMLEKLSGVAFDSGNLEAVMFTTSTMGTDGATDGTEILWAWY